jgi:hypothetical protein
VLFGFARAEEQSQIELRLAAAVTPLARHKALYLRHALDEARHARVFWTIARDRALVAGKGLPRPRSDVERLFERLGESRFLAFVHWGERRGRVQFETYARVLRKRGDLELAAAFENIVEDERRHERYTKALLGELDGARAPRTFAWAVGFEAWRSFRRAGRSFAQLSYAVLMAVVFVVIAPMALWFGFTRPGQRGFRASS